MNWRAPTAAVRRPRESKTSEDCRTAAAPSSNMCRNRDWPQRMRGPDRLKVFLFNDRYFSTFIPRHATLLVLLPTSTRGNDMLGKFFSDRGFEPTTATAYATSTRYPTLKVLSLHFEPFLGGKSLIYSTLQIH